MIAGGHDIDAGGEDFIGSIDGNAGPARRIFTVGDHHVDVVRLTQFWEKLPHSVPARLPHDVADKKKLHGQKVNGECPAGKKMKILAGRLIERISSLFSILETRTEIQRKIDLLKNY
jgi:hypothetical protein